MANSPSGASCRASGGCRSLGFEGLGVEVLRFLELKASRFFFFNGFGGHSRV